MKRKNLLILTTLLLTQATSVWAMLPEENTRSLKSRHYRQEQFRGQRNFKCWINHELNERDSEAPIPTNVGTAVEIILDNNSTLPGEYKLLAQWIFEEKPEDRRDKAILQLSVKLNERESQLIFTYPPVYILHNLVKSEPAQTMGYYFNGNNGVFQKCKTFEQWKNRKNEIYTRYADNPNQKIRSHQDGKIIYVEPFDLEDRDHKNKVVKSKYAYKGYYQPGGDLSSDKGLSGREFGNLIYSDGKKNIYLPHITQERWSNDQGSVGFFIASYQEEKRLNFLPDNHARSGAYIENVPTLPEGLYQLISVQENNGQGQRIETWQNLGNKEIREIKSTLGIPCIPGMGDYATRSINNTNSLNDVHRFIVHCKGLIDAHQGSMQDLRNILLTKLQNSPQGVHQTFSRLLEKPRVERNNTGKTLSLKGTILSTSDIKQALANDPNITKLNIFASNTFFIDEDLYCPGVLCNFVAPQWSVQGKRILNFCGKDGDPILDVATAGTTGEAGASGRPGNPGGNGGNLNGIAYTIKYVGNSLLTIQTSGGRGGDGQAGGRGGNGAAGVDAGEYFIIQDDMLGIPDNNIVRITMEEHPNPSPVNKISRITLRVGSCVDKISCFDKDQKPMGEVGGPGGKVEIIDFLPNEKLISIFGTSFPGKAGPPVLESIGFITNLKKWGPYGGKGEKGSKPFESGMYENGEIVGFLCSNYNRKKYHLVSKVSPLFICRENSESETLGQPGGDGGQGGAAGISGKPGRAVISGGADWIQADQDKTVGNSGNAGQPGDPGNGGIHGRPYLVDQGFQPNPARPASPGNRPNTLNTESQQFAVAQLTEEELKTERTNWHQECSTFYWQQALDSQMCLFLKPFHHLQNNL